MGSPRRCLRGISLLTESLHTRWSVGPVRRDGWVDLFVLGEVAETLIKVPVLRIGIAYLITSQASGQIHDLARHRTARLGRV